MKFKPGHAKIGGRKSGTPNRRTRFLHEVLDANGFSVVARLIELLPRLDVREQADVLVGLLPYLYPQRKPMDHYGGGTGESIYDPEEAPESTKASGSLSDALDALRKKTER